MRACVAVCCLRGLDGFESRKQSLEIGVDFLVVRISGGLWVFRLRCDCGFYRCADSSKRRRHVSIGGYGRLRIGVCRRWLRGGRVCTIRQFARRYRRYRSGDRPTREELRDQFGAGARFGHDASSVPDLTITVSPPVLDRSGTALPAGASLRGSRRSYRRRGQPAPGPRRSG